MVWFLISKWQYFSRENNCFYFCFLSLQLHSTEKLNKQKHLKRTPIIIMIIILVLCVRCCRGRAVNHHQPNLRRWLTSCPPPLSTPQWLSFTDAKLATTKGAGLMMTTTTMMIVKVVMMSQTAAEPFWAECARVLQCQKTTGQSIQLFDK